MKELIERYIQAHEHAWSETTKRSERYRLRALNEVHVLGSLPAELWDYLEKQQGAYSRVTVWTRVSSFFDWLVESGHRTGPNPYRAWRKTNAKQFKYCYERKLPTIGFEEALRRIETIEDRPIREACLVLLRGGLRISELYTYDVGTNTVRGKGGKQRRVYCGPFSAFGGSDAKLRKSLTLLGLKPHMLRKIAATEFRRRGLRDEDLLLVMGWNSMETAKSYLKPLNEEEIAAKLTA